VHALCVQLLRADPDDEEASMMMAELMFRKVGDAGGEGR
jgi:hypothetical protein